MAKLNVEIDAQLGLMYLCMLKSLEESGLLTDLFMLPEYAAMVMDLHDQIFQALVDLPDEDFRKLK